MTRPQFGHFDHSKLGLALAGQKLPSPRVWKVSCASRELTAVILAGGLGTRLRSAYSQGPKCMAPVGGRNFLEYLLAWLCNTGIREVVLCIGYRGAQLRRWLGDGSQWGCRFKYSSESKPLGTAGAIKKAKRLVNSSTLLVMNGDSFIDLDLRAMLDFHRQSKALVTMAVARVGDASRFGSLSLGQGREITAFAEKGKPGEISRMAGESQLVNAGVYLVEKPMLKSIPRGKALSLERDVFPGLIGRGLYGFLSNGYFVDIGTPESFRKAQTDLPRRVNR